MNVAVITENAAYTCTRCDTRMIRSVHTECEQLLGWHRVTRTTQHECPACSMVVKIILPLPPVKEA